MSLLKKMAQAAARKVFLATITGKAPADIKSCIEELCSDSNTVNALQHYATVMSKQEGQFPLTPAHVNGFEMSDAHKAMLADNPAILAYLNDLLSQFKQH